MSIPCMLLLATVAGSATFEQPDVRIEASVQSHIYEWVVTNVDGAPIEAIEFTAHFCYEFEAPDGWEKEHGPEHFRAWTDTAQRAIRPGRSGRFTARVSSRGAVLGSAPVEIDRLGDAPVQVIADVWSPVARTPWLIWLVPATLAVLAVGHGLLRHRRQGT